MLAPISHIVLGLRAILVPCRLNVLLPHRDTSSYGRYGYVCEVETMSGGIQQPTGVCRRVPSRAPMAGAMYCKYILTFTTSKSRTFGESEQPERWKVD